VHLKVLWVHGNNCVKEMDDGYGVKTTLQNIKGECHKNHIEYKIAENFETEKKLLLQKIETLELEMEGLKTNCTVKL